MPQGSLTTMSALRAACVAAVVVLASGSAHAEAPSAEICPQLVSMAQSDDDASGSAPATEADCAAMLAALSACTTPDAWTTCASAAESWLGVMACEPLCQGRPADALASPALATQACEGLLSLSSSLAGDAPVSEGIPRGARCAQRLMRDANGCATPAELLRCMASATTVEGLVTCRRACFGRGWPATSAVLADTTVRACDHVVPLARAAGDDRAIDETLSRDVCVIGMVMEDDWCTDPVAWLACVEAAGTYDEVLACQPVCRGQASATTVGAVKSVKIDDDILRETCEHVSEIVRVELGESGLEHTALGKVETCVADLRAELSEGCDQPGAALGCIGEASNLGELMACQTLCEATEPRIAIAADPEDAATARELCAHTATIAPELLPPGDASALQACAADAVELIATCDDWQAASPCLFAAQDLEAMTACLTHCGTLPP